MYADDTDCMSCSDCKKEITEKRWTHLLLNWLNKCVHPKSPITELNPWSVAEVLNKYKQDICANEIEGIILCSDVEAFVRHKYPLLRLRYYDIKVITKKMYLMTSIILFHCCISSVNGLVDGDICAKLSKPEQEMILKFCEKLMDMEVTANNIDLAIKEACDSVKQDPKTYKTIKPSRLKSDPSVCYEPFSTPEFPLSTLNSMAIDIPSDEAKQKYNASKFKMFDSESCLRYSTSDMRLSSFNSMTTDAAATENMSAKFQSFEYESFEAGALPGIPPLNSIMASGKSPTGSLKITTKFETVEYKSFEPSSSLDKPCDPKSLSKPPTGSTKKRINATFKSLEYEAYVPDTGPEHSSYNAKGLEYSQTGNVNPSAKPKGKSKNKYNESQSLSDKTYNSKAFGKSPTGSLKICLKAKSKDKYKSYELGDRSIYNTKAAEKKRKESRKKDKPKSKNAKYNYVETSPLDSIAGSNNSLPEQILNTPQFKSSVTVLPSAVTTDASYSDIDYVMTCGSKSDTEDKSPYMSISTGKLNVAHNPHHVDRMPTIQSPKGSERRCLPNCACSRCSPSGQCCADPGNAMFNCETNAGTGIDSSSDVYFVQQVQAETPKQEESKLSPFKRFLHNKTFLIVAVTVAVIILLIMLIILVLILTSGTINSPIRFSAVNEMEEDQVRRSLSANQEARIFQENSYVCKQGLCQKIYEPTSEYIYSSLSRCILLCMGPQLWPHPIGYTYYSKKIVVLTTSKLEYKFQSIPSEAVHLFLAEAFKLFLGDLAKLERYSLDARRMNISKDTMTKKMYIQMDIESDPDPRIRLDTEESYSIKVETLTGQVMIKLLSVSFCGLRHALETLSQLILLDQNTGNLITLSDIVIKDAPSYKYRGLMIDTGRNYIPVPDIMRTIDGMATVKLNTFHWRISDVTSFPLYLPAVPQLFEYGAYDRSLIYTKDDIKAIVRRAGIRGIRVLLEVAAPGPVGRAWSWIPEATCPTKNNNFTCNNMLCLSLGIHQTVFDILQIIYSEILEMTKVNDVFHLSDSMFTFVNCFFLLNERDGFLDKALERLKLANKGFLPKLPIIWYTSHLTKDMEAKTWDRFGVQLTEWHSQPSEHYLSRFKAIHSSRWDMSCEIKKQRCKKYRTWQEMYSWKSWRNLEVFTIEGGEAILWTDLVDAGNLDYHIWPRAAAVAERLWSDIALNGTVDGHVYVRLDSQRFQNMYSFNRNLENTS